MTRKSQNESLRFEMVQKKGPKIMVAGFGGAGSNAVDNMILNNLEEVEFVAVNTDLQALEASLAGRKIQIGKKLTKGLGAGGKPEVGKLSAEESKSALEALLQGVEMIFITVGLGGGTGTGAAPLVAKLAKEMDILTVCVATLPFGFERKKRMNRALAGLEEMEKVVDTIIVIPNDRIFNVIGKNESMKNAFKKADEVLYLATKGVSDIISVRGYMNVDFEDTRTVMTSAGRAIMGNGVASGDDRARKAAELAIKSPLLNNVDIQGAKNILINITGTDKMSAFEIQEAVNYIGDRGDEEAEVFVGIVHDESMNENISVTVIATGFSNDIDDLGGTPGDKPSKKADADSEEDFDALEDENDVQVPDYIPTGDPSMNHYNGTVKNGNSTEEVKVHRLNFQQVGSENADEIPIPTKKEAEEFLPKFLAKKAKYQPYLKKKSNGF